MASTRIDNPDAAYRIVGQVVDRASRRPIPDATVEARDLDTRYHDLLGQTVTDEQGGFVFAFDREDFGDYGGDDAPDLFFRVFVDGQPVLDTMATPMRNTPPGRTPVTLEIDAPTLPAARADRVSVEQIVKFTDWWQASDFKGVARESGSKLGTLARLLGGKAADKVAVWDFEPVRPTGTKETEIVGQAPQQAQNALAAQQVAVAEVRPVDARTRDVLRTLGDTPLALQPGDRVVLFEQDGQVKYYTRAPAADAATIDQQAVAGLVSEVGELKVRAVEVESLRSELAAVRSSDAARAQAQADELEALRSRAAEVERLQRELQQLRQGHAEKDAQIGRLTDDLAGLRAAQDNLLARLPLARLERLEQQVAVLGRVGGVPRAAAGEGAVPGAAAPAAPAVPVAPRRRRSSPPKSG